MKRRLARLLRAIGLIIAVPIVVFLALVLFFKAGRSADFRSQDRRLELLSAAEYAEDPTLSPSPESILMATRNLSDRVNPTQSALLLPFNRLSVIGSHNSYHRQADP